MSKRMPGLHGLRFQRSPEFGDLFVVRGNHVPADGFLKGLLPSLAPVSGDGAEMQFCHRYEGQHWDCAIKVTTVEVYILTAESSEKTSVSTTTYFTGHRHAALGLLPALSSDAPVTPPDPLGAIRAAVIRRTGSGLPLGGPQLRLDQATALAAHTIAAARAAGTAQRVGSLEPGKLADLAVLDTDPVAATPDQLDGIGVIQTWVGGTLRYQRPAASAATRRP